MVQSTETTICIEKSTLKRLKTLKNRHEYKNMDKVIIMLLKKYYIMLRSKDVKE